MKRLAYLALGATLLMTIGASVQPALAVCNSPRLITSGSSYVFTPGYEGGTGLNGSTISPDFIGAFWGIGGGDINNLLVGNDNGAFQAIGGWVGVYPGFPAYINSTWAASTLIDGCIDSVPGTPADRCMAILLTDNDANTGTGAFALLTDLADNLLNYNFEQPGAGPINLVTVPSLSINASVRTNTCSGQTCALDADCPSGETCEADNTCSGIPCDTVADCPQLSASGGVDETCIEGTGVDVSVGGIDLDAISAGLYLDPGCPQPGDKVVAAVIEGYQVYSREVDRGDQPPTDTAVANWTPVGPVRALDDPDPGPVSLSCTSGKDVYLAAAMVFDSGSGSGFVSGNSTRFECGANLAEPQELHERKPRSRKLRGGRTSSGR